MKIDDYKMVFLAIGLIGILFFSAPTISLLVTIPSSGQQFSELYVLGPDHKAENYPSDITIGQNYSIYVGVGNHLSSSAYYVLYVKFCNQTDQLPNGLTGTSSSVEPLFEYRFLNQPTINWETLLTFSVSNSIISENKLQTMTLQINNGLFNLNKPQNWDSNNSTIKYNLLIELWMYNAQSNKIEYNNRYVNLQLNLTDKLLFR